MSKQRYDIAVIGGGILGCSSALHLARGGMRVLLLEAGGLCMEASSRNAGTLAIQYPRAELTPYAMRSWEMWRDAKSWLGRDVGYREIGGLVLAFSDAEAERLVRTAGARQEAGAPIQLVDAKAARALEPQLSDKVVLASYCAIDGYADSTISALAFKRAMSDAEVDLCEGCKVTRVDRGSSHFVVAGETATFEASRILLAGGVWNRDLGNLLGLDLPVGQRINQMIVTERQPQLVTRMLGVVSGRLSLKQKPNGTVLIGGGWTGLPGHHGRSYRVDLKNLIGNLRLAGHSVPVLKNARVVRTWFGVRDHFPDYMPAIGALDSSDTLFLIACGVSGFTLGPFLGRLLADRILGRQAELPLFDPQRWLRPDTRVSKVT